MPSPKPLIRVRGLRKEYRVGDEVVVALQNIDLDFERGEIVSIFGTAGSGKSTLLNPLAGLEKPTRGTVEIGGVPVSSLSENALAAFRQKHLGFVFQSYNLLPTMTAAENVALPLMFRGVPREQRDPLARRMLALVGLKGRTAHYPTQMSGGQQQRVGIARAFIARPAVVYADEPTGNLDSKTTTEVMEMIQNFARRFKQTIIMVSHDPEMAAYADRVLTLRDGKIIADSKKGKDADEQNEA